MRDMAEVAVKPTLRDAVNVWLKIGLLSFGGPAAQIALMHKLVVSEKAWLSEKQFLNALSFCMLLPGPEAMQLATYAGWRLHGTVGGLVAGLLFILPGALVVFMLAWIYALLGQVTLINSLFLGVKAAVIIVVIEALLRVSKRALKTPVHWLLAALAFTGIFFLNLPFPLIVILAAVVGYLLPSLAESTAIFKPVSMPDAGHDETNASLKGVSLASTLQTIAVWLALWALPFFLLWMTDAHPLLIEIGRFFSQLAVVTFGGAYSVLAYLAQDVVAQQGWLSAGEMMDGLGLAETTPGPLILVTEFVGFLAGYRENGIGLALPAALMTLWVTFVPCFLWIFAGAPFIEWLGAQQRLASALAAITAAVVGVILNLSLWFALHVWFREVEVQRHGVLTLWTPELASLDWRAVLLTAVCGIAVFRFHIDIVWVLLLSMLAGLVLSMVVV